MRRKAATPSRLGLGCMGECQLGLGSAGHGKAPKGKASQQLSGRRLAVPGPGTLEVLVAPFRMG